MGARSTGDGEDLGQFERIRMNRDHCRSDPGQRIDQTRGDHFHTDWTSDGGEAPADVRSTIARARSVPKSVAIMTTCAVGSVLLRVVSANRPASS
jgi:hypothetical protein